MKSKISSLILSAFLGFAAVGESTETTQPKVQKENVKQQFGYVSLGLGPFPLPLPVFSIGYRSQQDHHGMDLSLQGTTLIEVTQLKTNFIFHYYPKPNLTSQCYIGAGVGPSFLLIEDSHSLLISPEFVFGKQYKTKTDDLRFFQAQISMPTFALIKTHSYTHKHHDIFKFPLVVFSYGWGF